MGSAQHSSVGTEANNISQPHLRGFFISSATAASLLFLDGRAWRTAVGAEYAAITLFGFQHSMAAGAFIKILAAIGRHFLLLGNAALRADDGALRDNHQRLHCSCFSMPR